MASDPAGERFERLEELFHRLVDLPPDERSPAMAELTAEDAGLARDLERLLAADAGRPAPLPPRDGLEPAAGRDLDEAGRYRLVRRLGEGGMGSVWEAEQLEPLRRRVAVKILRGGWLDGRRLVRRFLAERETLAQLEHPHIARILDAGVTRDGRPFFTMELVDGDQIDRFCERENLSIDQRVALFRQACRAVEYAHQRQVVHRDLKPSNLLVSRLGGDAVVKVIDFGIARALDEGGGDSGLTRTGELLGTPSYMSPEQLAGGGVDARSDVFSLGVVLYEILAGGSPFQRDTSASGDRTDPRTDGAPAPSRWLRTSAGASAAGEERAATLRERSRRLRGALDRIVLRAIEPRAADRYPTAGELDRDLGRHLAGERVTGTGGARRAVRRWSKRPALVAALAAGGAALLVFLGLQSGLNLERSRADAPLSRSGSATGGAAAARVPTTVAVLPLTDGGSDAAAHIAAELTDLLSSSLARLGGLRVTEPSSSREAAERLSDPGEIGARLGVEHLVRGRMTESGGGFRVSLELLRASSGEALWSRELEVERDALWTLPVDLATAIADQLAVPPPEASRLPLDVNPAPRSEALNAYLRGRHFWSRRTARDFDLAERHFREAIAADPEFALAHAGLADTFIMRALHGLEMPAEVFPLAAEHAAQALTLAPNLAEGLTAQAAIHLFFDWEPEKARAGFERAVSAGPSFTTARLGYADALLVLGLFEEALEQSEIMVSLAPFDRGLSLAHADFLRTAGRVDLALEQIRRTVELAPDFGGAFLMGAEIAGWLGDAGEVATMLGRASEAGADPGALRLSEAIARAWLGEADRARALLAQQAGGGGWGEGDSYKVAQAYAAAGKTETAFDWLERAAAARLPGLIFAGVSPAFEGLRGDERFVELVERLGLAH